MPDIRDFLPQFPWEGLPYPRFWRKAIIPPGWPYYYVKITESGDSYLKKDEIVHINLYLDEVNRTFRINSLPPVGELVYEPLDKIPFWLRHLIE